MGKKGVNGSHQVAVIDGPFIAVRGIYGDILAELRQFSPLWKGDTGQRLMAAVISTQAFAEENKPQITFGDKDSTDAVVTITGRFLQLQHVRRLPAQPRCNELRRWCCHS